jgi:hypothetical protein
MRGFIRNVWLLNPTTPSAGAGAAAQVPTQCLSLGKTALRSSALWPDPAAAVASTAMDFDAPGAVLECQVRIDVGDSIVSSLQGAG